MRILVVDEDIATLEAATRVLSAAGHDIETATSSAAALGVLERTRFDAVLLEVILRDLDGIETMMLIRRRWPRLPVLAMSAGGTLLGSQQLLSIANALGARATLQKPLASVALLGALEGLLEHPEDGAPGPEVFR